MKEAMTTEDKYNRELNRLEVVMNDCLEYYIRFKETLLASCMPVEEREERLELCYDVYIELREDYERYASIEVEYIQANN